jgi:hypothetical protein
MVSFIAPSKVVSHSLVQTLPPLLARETHDAAIPHLASVIPQHIHSLFQDNEPLSRETMSLLAKEMNGTKPALGRAFCSVVGSVPWQSGDLKSEASLAFANAVLPSLEVCLKNTASNPLSSPPGPLAGYIALAVLIGPLSRSGQFGEQISLKPSRFDDLTYPERFLRRGYHFPQSCCPIYRIRFIETLILVMGQGIRGYLT